MLFQVDAIHDLIETVHRVGNVDNSYNFQWQFQLNGSIMSPGVIGFLHALIIPETRRDYYKNGGFRIMRMSFKQTASPAFTGLVSMGLF